MDRLGIDPLHNGLSRAAISAGGQVLRNCCVRQQTVGAAEVSIEFTLARIHLARQLFRTGDGGGAGLGVHHHPEHKSAA
jgi:hypothetical protein